MRKLLFYRARSRLQSCGPFTTRKNGKDVRETDYQYHRVEEERTHD